MLRVSRVLRIRGRPKPLLQDILWKGQEDREISFEEASDYTPKWRLKRTNDNWRKATDLKKKPLIDLIPGLRYGLIASGLYIAYDQLDQMTHPQVHHGHDDGHH